MLHVLLFFRKDKEEWLYQKLKDYYHVLIVMLLLKIRVILKNNFRGNNKKLMIFNLWKISLLKVLENILANWLISDKVARVVGSAKSNFMLKNRDKFIELFLLLKFQDH